MEKIVKLFIDILTVCMLFLSVGSECLAADETIDLSHSGSITINLDVDGELSVNMYKVAGVTNNDGTLGYTFTDAFKNCALDLTDLNSSELVSSLSDYVKKYEIKSTDQKIGTDGTVHFENLDLGLYLFVQKDSTGSSYQMESFLVTVPNLINDQWIYDVNAGPKTEVKTLMDISVKKVWNDDQKKDGKHPDSITVMLYLNDEEIDEVTLSESNNWSYTWKDLASSDSYSVKETTMKDYQATYKKEGNTFIITNTAKLAHTGQLNWPVPVLAIGGMLLFSLGWYLVFIKAKKED